MWTGIHQHHHRNHRAEDRDEPPHRQRPRQPGGDGDCRRCSGQRQPRAYESQTCDPSSILRVGAMSAWRCSRGLEYLDIHARAPLHRTRRAVRAHDCGLGEGQAGVRACKCSCRRACGGVHFRHMLPHFSVFQCIYLCFAWLYICCRSVHTFVHFLFVHLLLVFLSIPGEFVIVFIVQLLLLSHSRCCRSRGRASPRRGGGVVAGAAAPRVIF